MYGGPINHQIEQPASYNRQDKLYAPLDVLDYIHIGALSIRLLYSYFPAMWSAA